MLVLAALLQAVPPPTLAERTGAFASPRVRESSGLVVSRVHAGVLWTNNDSGDGPYLYATDTTGADLGARRVDGAEAVDWEDLSTGPCPRSDRQCLYVADTGDNQERRVSVTIYAVPEPAPPGGLADTTGSAGGTATLRLRYPDGAHDVEAIFVTPSGAVYLVTKGRTPPVRVFSVPRSAWSSSGVVTATAVQTLTIPLDRTNGALVTGAALAPNGRSVAVRTYRTIYFYTLANDGRLAPAGACELGRLEPQGEAAAFLNDSTLILSSEAVVVPGPLHAVRCAFERPT